MRSLKLAGTALLATMVAACVPRTAPPAPGATARLSMPPATVSGLVDRLLVACHAGDVPPVLVWNKSDLTPTPESAAVLGLYEAMGYEVVRTSAATGPADQHASPVNISRTVTAQLQTSVVRARGRPAACSGEQYASVRPPQVTSSVARGPGRARGYRRARPADPHALSPLPSQLPGMRTKPRPTRDNGPRTECRGWRAFWSTATAMPPG